MTSEISDRFCAPDADITISSSDGVLFKLHRKNLEMHSDVFADASAITLPENGDEPVKLPEPSDVLDLLFQYMYRQPAPDLDKVEFCSVAGLAEAAEKYVVHAAIAVCRFKMKESITAHSLEVFDYAIKHGQDGVATDAARQSMGLKIHQASVALSPAALKEWSQFRDQWDGCVKKIIDENLGKNNAYVARKCLQDANIWSNKLLREQLRDSAFAVTLQAMSDMTFIDSKYVESRPTKRRAY